MQLPRSKIFSRGFSRENSSREPVASGTGTRGFARRFLPRGGYRTVLGDSSETLMRETVRGALEATDSRDTRFQRLSVSWIEDPAWVREFKWQLTQGAPDFRESRFEDQQVRRVPEGYLVREVRVLRNL